MVTVKTKEELKKAIEDGEKRIKIDSLKLYAACKLAESYYNAPELLKHRGKDASDIGPKKNMQVMIDGTVVTIVLGVAVLITAVAIVGILKEKKVKIKCENGDKVVTIEVG